MRKSFRVLLITLHALKKGNQFVKKTLCLILTLLTFVTLAFAPNAFAQDTSLDYVVRTIYFVPKDRESNPNMDRKLDSLMKGVKQFYADLMEYHGFGEKTFRLETDATGNTIVHHVTGKFNNAYYQNPEERNGSLIVWDEIEEQFDTSKNIYLMVLDTSDGIVIGDLNPAGLGSGGSHNGRVLLPAHNYNAASHELGHAFGLPHDPRIDASRWTARSSDPMITSFCAAEWLDVNRYFNPIQEASVDNKPSFQMSTASLISAPHTIRLQFEVADPDGLHQAQLFRASDKGGPSTFNYPGVIACKKLDGKTTTVEFVTSELTVLNPRVLLRLIDVHGNFTASQSFDLDLTDLLPQTEMISIPDPNLSSTATVPKDGLLVHYTFEETEGTTAADVSGNGNNATLTGNAGWYPTGALQLDGSNNTSAVDEDAENYLNGLTAITIALWVKADTTEHNSGFIYGDWTGSGAQDRSLVLRYDRSGNRGSNVITAVVPTAQRTYQRYESARDVQTTEWQHITLTWSSGNQIALYINGELDVPTYNDQLTVGSVSRLSRLLIGQSSFDHGTSWRGLIDEVLIYNRVLTQQEITGIVGDIPTVDTPPINVVPLPIPINVVPLPTNTSKIKLAVGSVTWTTTPTDTEDITYTLRVTNIGDTLDQINLTVSGDVDTAILDKTSVTLQVDAHEDVTLTIPRAALSDIRTYSVTVTATSGNDSTITDIVNTKTTVTVADARLENGLLVHYTFDESEGAIASDASGNGRDASLIGNASWNSTGGRIGGALQLDGSQGSSAVDEDGEDYLNGLTALTVALWVKADAIPNSVGLIYGNRVLSGTIDRSLVIRYNSRDKNILAAVRLNDAKRQEYRSASDVQTTAWQHIVLTWQSGDRLALYINGVLDTPTYNDNAIEGSVASLDKFLIGQASFDQQRSWSGLIDDVRVYNRVLPRQEITDLASGIVNPKTTVTDDPSPHKVVFSEVMFESEGGEGSLPQWIEVYNNSTNEVNLRGWKLHWKRLQPTLLEVTTTFKEDFRIPAQQSRLIITALGRHSGGGNLSDEVVYQLHVLHAEELAQNDIANRNRLITRGGFSLKLTNSKGVLVDHIGTLIGDKQSWQLHECLVEGVRTALIRRFDEGVPRAGTERRGWRRAIDAKRLAAGIYYGSQHDLGTPGYRRGKPLPVELSQFSARFVDGQVMIKWTTESELDNAGFNILRSQSKQGRFVKVNPTLIQGAGTTGERNEYTWTDTTAKPNTVYYYQIEDVSHAGVRKQLATVRLRGLVSASGKFITRWADLKSENP